MTNNCAKVVGYVPGLNLLVAAAQIIFYAPETSSTDPEKQARALEKMKRALATGCFGPLLIFADLYYTHQSE